jgi:thiamine kinase
MIPARQLALVPGCETGHAPLAVLPLPGGCGRNEVLRLTTKEGQFVWRRRLGPVDRPGACALTELSAHRAAAAAGIAPGIIAAAEDGAWILMEFIDAPHWSADELCSAAGMERLGARLAQLHGLPVPKGVPVADCMAMAAGYLHRVQQRDAAIAAGLQPLADRVRQVTNELGGAGRRALVHGDLMASNMLGPLPLLVDWEYAQAEDPSWDIACLLQYYPSLHAWLGGLLASAGLDGAEARERFRLQNERFGLLTRLWEQAYPAGGSGRAG